MILDSQRFKGVFIQNLKRFGKKRRDPIYINRFKLLDEVITEWVTRLGGKSFHGDDRGPDRADLMMFSTIQRKLSYREIKNIIN